MSEEEETQPGSVVSSLDATISAINQTLFNPEEIVRVVVSVGRGLLSVYTVPLELALKPDFGTRYINPVTWAASFMVMHLFALFGFYYKLSSFMFNHETHGVFGMGTLLACFYIGTILHIIRIAHLVKNPKLENDSMWDGKGWPPVFTVAKDLWVRQRALIEPGLIITVTVMLYFFHAIDIFAAAYLVLGAFCYSLKSVLVVYETWTYIRDTLDSSYRTRILSDERLQKMMPQQLGGKILAAIPQDAGDRAFIARAMFGFSRKRKPEEPPATPTANTPPTPKPNGYDHLVSPLES